MKFEIYSFKFFKKLVKSDVAHVHQLVEVDLIRLPCADMDERLDAAEVDEQEQVTYVAVRRGEILLSHAHAVDVVCVVGSRELRIGESQPDVFVVAEAHR